jgi:hypothetical protein
MSQAKWPAAMARGRAGDVHAAAPNVSTYAPELRVGQLVDRAGRVFSEQVITNWSPQTIRLFGLHRVGDDPSRRSPSSNEFSDLADGQIEDTANAAPGGFKRAASTQPSKPKGLKQT